MERYMETGNDTSDLTTRRSRLVGRLATLRARKFVRRAERAVTLIEVLVVIAIIATISGIVAFAVFPKLAHAKVEAAVQSAKTIRDATDAYLQLGSDDGNCPTIKTLLDAKQIKADATDDPWGSPFRIQCDEGGDIHVFSNGKDKQEGTGDDIRDDFKKSDIDRVANIS
jgi:general secretion pathway protein G